MEAAQASRASCCNAAPEGWDDGVGEQGRWDPRRDAEPGSRTGGSSRLSRFLVHQPMDGRISPHFTDGRLRFAPGECQRQDRLTL